MTRRGHEPGAAAGAGRAAVRGADRCRRRRRPTATAPGRRSCSSSGPGPWRPGFEPDAGELAVIAEIVRRLDGLPLAIELAAARLHTHDVAEVAAGLDHRFALLSSGYRTSSRHGSLERRRVVVVRAARRPPAADLRRPVRLRRVVHGGRRGRRLRRRRRPRPRPPSHQLAERSLVMRAPDRRFVLLETLRAFGAEQLAADGPGRGGRRAPRPPPGRLGRARPTGGCWRRGAGRRSPRSTPRSRSCAPRSAGCSTTTRSSSAGRLVAALLDYGFLRLRPDVLAWAERVTEADPDDRSPLAPLVWVAARLRGVDGRRRRRDRRPQPRGPLQAGERAGGRGAAGGGHASAATSSCSRAASTRRRAWYRRAADAAADDPAQRLLAASTEVLALAYAGDPTADDAADGAAGRGRRRRVTPYAAYAWYCAGEADLARRRRAGPGPLRPGPRAGRARRTRRSSPALAGASKASIDARLGDPRGRRRGLPPADRPLAAGRDVVDAVDDAALDRRAAGPARAAPGRGRAGGRGAGDRRPATASSAPTRSRSTELGARLRAELGDDGLRGGPRARARALDGDAAVEHALRALLSAARTATGHQRGCSARTPSTALPTISWVMASLPGWKPPQRTSR